MSSKALHNRNHFAFASDNYSGVHPAIMDAIITANGGHQTAYGDDIYSRKLDELIAECFGQRATSYPVFNGTGANIIALSALTPRHGAVICTTNAHIYNDESNAPAYVAGLRLLPVKTADGKLTPAHIKSICQSSQGNPPRTPAHHHLSQSSYRAWYVLHFGRTYRHHHYRQIIWAVYLS